MRATTALENTQRRSKISIIPRRTDFPCSQVSNIVVKLPTGKRLVDGISFSVGRGEFVSILGSSGAGKSLTLRCIVGLTQPCEGEITLTGPAGKAYRTTRVKANELRRARRHIGLIFQGSNLVKRLTVLENVMLGRLGHIHPLRSWLLGFKDSEAREAMEALDRVNMASFAARVTGSLSGGEMQRVSIARAIFQKPLIYLADEPISSVDPKNAEAIMSILLPLSRETPVIGAFHQPATVAKYCTRVIGIRGGKMVYDGPANLSVRQLERVYGDSDNEFHAGSGRRWATDVVRVGIATRPASTRASGSAGLVSQWITTSALIPFRQELPFLDWKKEVARQRWKSIVAAAIVVGLTVFASWRCNVDVYLFVAGIGKGISLLQMFFPDWSSFMSMLQPLGVTAVMALIATILGMCLSLPCALAASSNIAPPVVRRVMRAFIALERGLPEIVQMLLLIVIFGLGAVPGPIALAVSSIGMLAKLLADSIEEIEPQMLEAVAGTGARPSQIIRYAVIPQILPSLLANGLFRFEFNVRAGVILGAIGAGGIGYVMSTSMNSMDYQRACMATLLTLGLVFASERVSDFFRARILGGGQLP